MANYWQERANALDNCNRAREVWFNVRRTICRLGEQPHFLAAEARTYRELELARAHLDKISQAPLPMV